MQQSGIYDATLDYFSLFKVNQERVNSLFIQVHCTSLQEDGVLLFYRVSTKSGYIGILIFYLFIILTGLEEEVTWSGLLVYHTFFRLISFSGVC